MKYFKLPDLGEGLQEAEIVEWHIKPGEEIKTDQLLVSVETAKAIVEVPSPQDGVIQTLFGGPGDILHVGEPLVEFAGETQEDSGTVVDHSPFSNNGTVTGATQGAIGVFHNGKSLSLDGVNDYVTVPQCCGTLGLTKDLTILAWVNFSTSATTDIIVAKTLNSVAGPYNFRITTGDKLRLLILKPEKTQ